ncbi:MAG TPA: aspartate/glutamate racemase family protein [Streptosporangiaceae bacterium]|nr:aspartate/glutamate racemase family protein [Streptosporangiaceae bacterium]
MRFALVDSGLGVLPAAMHLRRLCPGAELVLSMDPEGMPWGPRNPDDIAERALACAQATLPWQPDVLVLACNTASVRALDLLRRELEPAVPVVGTVPAIKPAAAGGGKVAIWATAATTGSPYQHELIRKFASGAHVTEVACPGLAAAIECADAGAISDAIEAAGAFTPPDTRAVVLGCTQYELAMDRIRGVLPRVHLHGSAPAVAAQAIRRLAARPPAPADAAPGSADHRQASSMAHGHNTPAAQDHAPRGQLATTQTWAVAGATLPPGGPSEPVASPGLAASAGHAWTSIPTDPSGPAEASGRAEVSGPAEASDPAEASGPGKPSGPTQRPEASGAPAASEPGAPVVHVLLSGAPGELPAAALRYAEGRLLAGLRLSSTVA